VQSVPEPATRANLVERGDADIVVDLQASDVQSLEVKGKLKVVSTPQYNAVTFVSMNNQIPPFDNVNVRRAIAYALPYDDMFKAALFGRGAPLFGATWADGQPSSGAYPIPQPVKLDLDKAKDYLKAAGFPSSPRASSPGCLRPTISTAISTPEISAGTTRRSTTLNWWRSRRKPVLRPTRRNTRKTAGSSTPSISPSCRRSRSGSPARTR
jgi:ABC-type transport system substrate-binding protein